MSIPYPIDYDQAKEEFLYHADQYLTPDRSGKGWICPICGSGSGPNGTGIVRQKTSKTGGKQEFTCFGHGHCFEQEDLLDIIAIKNGIETNKGNFTKIIEAACEEFNYYPEYIPEKRNLKTSSITKSVKEESKQTELNTDPEQYRDFILKASEDLNTSDGKRALRQRGISIDTAKKASRVGFDLSGKYGFPGLVFSNGDNFTSFSIRNSDINAEKSNRYRKRGPAEFFNFENIKKSNYNTPYFLVEGEIDALSIIEAGGEAVALGSTVNISKFIKRIQEENLKKPVIVTMDNDEAGEIARKKITQSLDEIGDVSYITSSFLEDYNYNDPNEFLVDNKNAFIECVNEEIESFAYEIDGFSLGNALAKKYLRRLGHNSRPISTGFPILDNVLAGGLYGGALYCIGAPSSVGKTSFSHSIADHISEKGQNVIYFTFEMSSSEMLVKTISRLSYLEGFENPLTVNDFDNDEAFNNLTDTAKTHLYRVFNKYINTIGPHMLLNEGEIGEVTVDKVEEIIKSFIKNTETKPVVFLDYLQVLQQPKQMQGSKSDKQIVDYNVFKIKRMARKYNIPIFVISSFNRQSYDEPSMSAFKESGSIEFTADCVLTLFRNTIGLKKKEADELIEKEEESGVRKVILTVLKNRRGKVGTNILYEYHPAYNYFEEISEK